MTEHDDRIREMERRLEKDWGPEISPRRRLLAALTIVVVSVGLVLAVFVTAMK
jgi:hypothetical protein